jgi:hypothetical protein
MQPLDYHKVLFKRRFMFTNILILLSDWISWYLLENKNMNISDVKLAHLKVQINELKNESIFLALPNAEPKQKKSLPLYILKKAFNIMSFCSENKIVDALDETSNLIIFFIKSKQSEPFDGKIFSLYCLLKKIVISLEEIVEIESDLGKNTTNAKEYIINIGNFDKIMKKLDNLYDTWILSKNLHLFCLSDSNRLNFTTIGKTYPILKQNNKIDIFYDSVAILLPISFIPDFA